MRFTRTTAATAATGLAVFTVLTGCGKDSTDGAQSSGTTVTAAVTSSTTAPPPATATPDSALAALSTAAAAVPGGQPFDLEVERTGEQQQFEVKVAADGTEVKIVVDAAGTAMVSQTPTDKPDDDLNKLAGTTVTATQALQTAVEMEPSAQVHEVEIDTDSAGTVVWEVELVRADGSKVEYAVDARTGAVLRP